MSQASKHVKWCLNKAKKEAEECRKLGKRLWHELNEDRLYQHPFQILVYQGRPEQLAELKALGESRKIPVGDAIDARVTYLIEKFADAEIPVGETIILGTRETVESK